MKTYNTSVSSSHSVATGLVFCAYDDGRTDLPQNEYANIVLAQMQNQVVDKARYRKYPEFNRLGEIVLKFLEMEGKTIVQDLGGRQSKIHPDNRDFVDKPVWHRKAELDVFVLQELGRRMENYATGKKNKLYTAVANEISYLRREGVIIDLLQNPKTNLDKGIWRLARPLDVAAKTQAIKEMNMKNFYSKGIETSALVRAKQSEFRKYLLKRDSGCLFCRFNLERWMIGAHIVPYSVMREDDPHNSMNYSNGLLLCRMCDVAFEHGYIIVEGDYGITITERLRDARAAPVKSWLAGVGSDLHVNKNASYNPGKEFLEKKKRMITGR